MNLLVWVVVATAISLCGGVGMLVFKQQRKRNTLRPWEPWAYALGLQPSLTINGGITLKGNFENIPVILTSAGVPGTHPVGIQLGIMSMTHRSFALPQDLSSELQQTFTRIQPQLETIALTGATLDVVLRSEHTRVDTLIDLLTQLSAIVQEITHQQNTPDEDLASTPRSTKYIQLAQFLEQNLSMQHTGRPKGWELTGINTFTGHHVSFNMDIQSIDQTGTLRGPLRHSVYTIVVTGFPIDEEECPTLGTQFQGIGTITHLNVVGRTAEILWRCANEDYT